MWRSQHSHAQERVEEKKRATLLALRIMKGYNSRRDRIQRIAYHMLEDGDGTVQQEADEPG